MLDDPEAGEMAAWALGRIDGGRDALISCLAQRCPTSRAAARALSGPAAFKQPAMEALIAALSGPAADEAAFSLGVLARNKDAKFPTEAYAALDLPQAREAFRDEDGRVRGTAAGAAGAAFGAELRRLLGDPDPYVVQEAAGALAKLPADPATKTQRSRPCSGSPQRT